MNYRFEARAATNLQNIGIAHARRTNEPSCTHTVAIALMGHVAHHLHPIFKKDIFLKEWKENVLNGGWLK